MELAFLLVSMVERPDFSKLLDGHDEILTLPGIFILMNYKNLNLKKLILNFILENVQKVFY